MDPMINLGNRRSIIVSDEVATKCKFQLDVHTYLLVLEMSHLDMERKTCNVWVEIGFQYDIHDYLRTFDNFVSGTDKINSRNERLKNIAAQDMEIAFDILNAIEMTKRTEAHFIRKTDGFQPSAFYSESPEWNRKVKEDFLSDAKNLVNNIDASDCPRFKYWKHETKTFSMELSFRSTERLAPFDQIHLFFKLITANCQPGTNRIRFVYNEAESDFSGMKHPINGFYPFTNESGEVVPIINQSHGYSNSETTWDRLYISVSFQKSALEQIITFYIVPYLLFNYMIIKPINNDVESLLGISSTLVIANVALLIVTSNNVFTFYEQAVLIQILTLIVATLIMGFVETEEHSNTLQIVLGFANFGILVILFVCHYMIAWHENKRILTHIQRGEYAALDLS